MTSRDITITSQNITIPSHFITSPLHHHPIPILTEIKGELTDAPQYRPALSIKESEKLLESLDDMTDAEVAAVLSKLKAAVSERIKSKSPCLALPYLALLCFALPCSALPCLALLCHALFCLLYFTSLSLPYCTSIRFFTSNLSFQHII